MDEKEALGKVVYEARRAYWIEKLQAPDMPPWELINREYQLSYIASGEAVANYVKRDLAGLQFSAFVGAGALDLAQRLEISERKLAEIESKERQHTQELERLTTLINRLQRLQRP